MTALASNRFHGAPCPKGCGTERYLSGGQCCKCVRLASIAREERFRSAVAAAVPAVKLVPSTPALTGRFIDGPWRACPIDMCPFCGTTIKDAFDRGRHIHDCRRRHQHGASS